MTGVIASGNERAMAQILSVTCSTVSLPPHSNLRRTPRVPNRKRSSSFQNAFEEHILYYDCFQYSKGRVLLVGPPPLNLKPALGTARYSALPSGRQLAATLHPSRSTMITELHDVPSGTDMLRIEVGELRIETPINAHLHTQLAGHKLLFSINKDNHLEWIRFWANWHVQTHGTDTILLFDNDSQSYSLSEIEQTLASVPGLRSAIVVPLPFKFGPIDKWVLFNRFWPRFLQISATNIALRRFGMGCAGIIHCDIDELVWSGDISVYDLTAQSKLGALRVPGQWIEAVTVTGSISDDHRAFRFRRRGLKARLSPPKCTLDPGRDWIQNLSVHPYLHRIHGAPRGGRSLASNAMFWHFRGINTNWKEQRTTDLAPDPAIHEIDRIWELARSTFGKN